MKKIKIFVCLVLILILTFSFPFLSSARDPEYNGFQLSSTVSSSSIGVFNSFNSAYNTAEFRDGQFYFCFISAELKTVIGSNSNVFFVSCSDVIPHFYSQSSLSYLVYELSKPMIFYCMDDFNIAVYPNFSTSKLYIYRSQSSSSTGSLTLYSYLYSNYGYFARLPFDQFHKDSINYYGIIILIALLAFVCFRPFRKNYYMR